MIDPMEPFKICPKCKTNKHLSDFHNNKRNKDGKQSYCKDCINKEMKKLRDADPQTNRDRARAWAKSNPEKVLEKARKNRKKKKLDKMLQNLDELLAEVR